MDYEQLVNEVAVYAGESKRAVDTVLKSLAAVTRNNLKFVGDLIAIPGLGRLKVSQRQARMSRNPRTGGQIEVPAKRAVKFVAAQALKDSANHWQK